MTSNVAAIYLLFNLKELVATDLFPGLGHLPYYGQATFILTNTDFKFYRRVVDRNHGGFQKACVQLVFSTTQKWLNKDYVILRDFRQFVFNFFIQFGLQLYKNAATVTNTFALPSKKRGRKMLL